MVDVIQSAFSAGEISNDLYGRVELDWYRLALAKCRNSIVHPHGGVSNRAGTHFVGEVIDSTRRSRLVGFQFSADQTYILEFGHLKKRVIKNGLFVLDGPSPYELVTPLTEDQAQTMNTVQSADTVFITHGDHAPQELVRFDHDDWSINNMSFTPLLLPPPSLSGLASAAGSPLTYKYVVTAEDEGGNESLATTILSVSCSDMEATDAFVTLTWTASANAESYNVYKETNESGTFGWIGRATALKFKDKNIRPDNLSSPIFTAKNPFDSANNYPSVVTFYEERLVFAATYNKPQTIFMSHTGRYNYFSVSKPARADEAVTFTPISRKVSPILNLADLNDLISLTGVNEWRVHGGNQGDAIAPDSINPKRQTNWGSAPIPPLLIGDVILFVQKGSRKVRALGYSLESDGYKGNDLTIRVPHFFEDGVTIVDMAYAQEPYSIVWCVLSSGDLAAFTYIQEQNVWAWHLHDTDGQVENVEVITEGDYDVLYMVVKRHINGSDKRYIEYMDNRTFTDVEDSFFVDSGLTYSGVPIETVNGLDHLEGKEVAVLADGNVQNRKTVSGGSITLDKAASKLSIGLPYRSYIETLRIAVNAPAGAQNKTKIIEDLTIRVKNTRGIAIGESLDSLQEIKPDSFLPDAPIPMFTGDLEGETYDTSWEADGQVVIAQDSPLPMTITAIIPKVRIGG